MGMEHRTWAEEEFGGAELGDARRTARLVKVAEAVMEKPHAIVLKAIEEPKDREGTYRFLESEHLPTDEMEAARGRACLRRMDEVGGTVIIPVDQTSFTLPDHTGERDFGSVGNRGKKARGVQCMTALGLDARGTPLGIVSQLFWARSETAGPKRIRANKKAPDSRPADQKESKYWAQILEGICEQVAELSPEVRPWLQCDRGADFWKAFDIAGTRQVLITVRVYANRQIELDDGKRGQLLPWMEALPEVGTYEVYVPARKDRPARVATLSVRHGRTRLRLGATRGGRKLQSMDFVYAREVDPPEGVKPLCWRLATTYPVNSTDDAMLVVGNYSLRWRIEELHRTVKSGTCDLERCQLESFEAFRRWAIIHTSVAARVERLKLLSRTQPEAPASIEFSREEIDTMIMVRHKHMVRNKPPYKLGDTPTLAEMTLWIADWGGYAGPRRQPKPGSVPLSRGLERLEIAVETLCLTGFFASPRSD